MRLWTCVDHDSFWIGGASIVLAENEELAKELMRQALVVSGLNPDEPFTLIEVDTAKPQAIVLKNGDY